MPHTLQGIKQTFFTGYFENKMRLIHLQKLESSEHRLNTQLSIS